MEFSISISELARGLHRAQGIVEKRTALPILSNVLVEASKSRVSITATDLEVGVTGHHKAQVAREGSLTLSARHFYDIIRSLPKDAGDVTVKKLDNNWAEILCGSTARLSSNPDDPRSTQKSSQPAEILGVSSIEYRLLGMDAEEFQGLPEISQAKLFPIDPAALKAMIDKVLFAVSTDETRYMLNGAFFEQLGKEGFRMVSTDGHRLSCVDSKLAKDPKAAGLEAGVIIPRKGLAEMKRLLENEEGPCSLGFSENNLVLRLGDVTAVMRLLDGQFPDYRQVIPESQKVNLVVDRKALVDGLRRVSIVSSDQKSDIKIQIRKGRLRVSTSNMDLGEAREDLKIDYLGKEMIVGFNARYMLDALNSIDTDQVDLSLEDDLSPGVLRPAGDQTHTCVVMPMRI